MYILTVEHYKYKKLTDQKSYYGTVMEELQVLDNNQQVGFEIGLSRTINLGDYNSAKIDLRVTYPTSKDRLETDYEDVSNWLVDKFQSALSSVLPENS